MELRIFRYAEVETLYPRVYAEVFGRAPAPSDHPSFVALGYEDDAPIGFLSGYAQDDDTLYVQRIGLFPDHRSEGRALELWRDVARLLRRDGYRWLTGTVRSDNPIPLVVALKAGWRVVGFKQDSRGVGYVLTLLDLQEETR